MYFAKNCGTKIVKTWVVIVHFLQNQCVFAKNFGAKMRFFAKGCVFAKTWVARVHFPRKVRFIILTNYCNFFTSY